MVVLGVQRFLMSKVPLCKSPVPLDSGCFSIDGLTFKTMMCTGRLPPRLAQFPYSQGTPVQVASVFGFLMSKEHLCRSPPAPLGNMTVNTTAVSDKDTGRDYVNLPLPITL